MSVDSICHILIRTCQESCSCVSACRLMYPLSTCFFACQPVLLPLTNSNVSYRHSLPERLLVYENIFRLVCPSEYNELTRGPPELVQPFRLYGGVHIGARALLDPKLIRFGYITRLSQSGGGGGVISSFK